MERARGGLRSASSRFVAALVLAAIFLALPAAANAAGPPLPGVRAAALIEESSGQELFGLNQDAPGAIASTTKLMTALVTLRHTRLRDVFTDPDFYLPPQDSQIHLVPGERMSVHDLLIALMLPSADDAAEDLAYNVGHGSVSRFVAMMNARARQLHLNHTHYTTPIGLDTPGNYSSAHDLVTLARYLLRSEPFIRAVASKKSAVLRTGNQVRHVINRNDLVARFPWVNGVKTGHTLQAGYVLVASGTRDGMSLIGVVLGTASEAARDASALALLNYGFANFGPRTPVHAGEVLGRLPVKDQPTLHPRLIATKSYTHVFPRSARIRIRVRTPRQLTGPLPAHAVVGSAAVVVGGRVQARIPLELVSAVPKLETSKGPDKVVVLSATLSGLVLAVGAAIGLRMFWREWTRG
ncbi:MAG TPA: D-alanyl-D-alanine carboxypeptidase family protein [Solirubrobacteraceae bacterium]|nr:D-alanyl-D-alanine carboxypeptidase family protein [Solirubrobacteraceae bacterium]